MCLGRQPPRETGEKHQQQTQWQEARYSTQKRTKKKTKLNHWWNVLEITDNCDILREKHTTTTKTGVLSKQ